MWLSLLADVIAASEPDWVNRFTYDHKVYKSRPNGWVCLATNAWWLFIGSIPMVRLGVGRLLLASR